MIWVILVVFVLLFIFVIVRSRENEKTIQNTKSVQDKFLRESGITKSADYDWHDTMSEQHYRFIADDKAQKVYISSGITGTKFEEIPYEQIIGFEVFEDSQVVGGIKRAIVGGAFAGVAGAIVGSQTANKKAVSSMKAVLYLENISKPQLTFDLIHTKTKLTDSSYISAKAFTDKINAVIKAIISKMQHTEKASSQKEIVSEPYFSNDDIAEKLRRLKIVFDDGLITKEEYEEKKKEILSTI